MALATFLFLPAFFIFIIQKTQVSGQSIPSGQKLFENRCARCHGLNAAGSPEMAKTLKVDPVKLNLMKESVVRTSRARLEKLVAGGHGRMPRQEHLTPGQIRSLVKYLQNLQKAFVLK